MRSDRDHHTRASPWGRTDRTAGDRSRGRARRRGATLGLVAVVATVACADVLGPDDPVPLAELELPDSVVAAYAVDAAHLAVRHVEAARDSEVVPVELPTALADTLHEALLRVYAFDHPARDEVVEVYRVHAIGRPSLHEVIVGIDTTVAWTRSWLAGERLTGNAVVDSLLETYAIDVELPYDWAVPDWVVLRAAEPLNAPALARRFGELPAVRYAGTNDQVGDGPDIRAVARDDGWRLDYSIGWGDCPAGCIYDHTWSFAVDAAGRVDYLGEDGAPPPEP